MRLDLGRLTIPASRAFVFKEDARRWLYKAGHARGQEGRGGDMTGRRSGALFYQHEEALFPIYSNEFELPYAQLMQGAANLSGARSRRAQYVAIDAPHSGCAIGTDKASV